MISNGTSDTNGWYNNTWTPSALGTYTIKSAIYNDTDKNYIAVYNDTKTLTVIGHDIAVTSVVPSKTIVGQGYSMNINVTVENQGSYTESFNVSVFYDDTIITLPDGKNHTTTTLPSGDSTTLTLTWNTTGVAKGNYTITAEATQLPYETDTTDNTLSDGWVFVTIPGDVNGDKYVNIKDAVLLGVAFGSKQGEPTYNPNADINNGGYINIKDAVIQGANFGKSWT